MIASAVHEPYLISFVRLSGLCSWFRCALLGLSQNPRSSLHGYLKQLCHDLCQITENLTVFPQLPQQYPEVCATVIKENHHYLQHINSRTYEMCKLAVSTPPSYSAFTFNSAVLQLVPLRYRTHELCLVAVTYDHHALEFVPEDLKTSEMCWAAVRKNPLAFKHVPPEIQTPELCSFVMKKRGDMYCYVQYALRNEELLISALKSYPKLVTVLELFGGPGESRQITPTVLSALVKRKPSFVHLIPVEYQTEDLCLFAVREDPKVFRHVPQDFQTPAVCRTAISGCYENIRHVANLNPEMILPLLTPEGLEWVASEVIQGIHELADWQRFVFRTVIVGGGEDPPNQFLESTTHVFKIDPELRRLAIETDPMKWLSHTAPHCTDQDFTTVIEKNGLLLQFVPLVKHYTTKVCHIAVQQNGLALQYVVPDRKTLNLCRAAVEKNGLALQYVPIQWKTPEICQAAVDQTPDARLFAAT